MVVPCYDGSADVTWGLVNSPAKTSVSDLRLCDASVLPGARVPVDVSVVGYDDIPEAAHLLPPLTTVRTEFAEIGRRSLRLLVNRITSSDDAMVDPVVPVELIVRRSTGPAVR